LQIEIGNQLGPMLTWFGETLKAVIVVMSEWAASLGTLIAIVVGVTAAVLAFGVAIWAVGTASLALSMTVKMLTISIAALKMASVLAGVSLALLATALDAVMLALAGVSLALGSGVIVALLAYAAASYIAAKRQRELADANKKANKTMQQHGGAARDARINAEDPEAFIGSQKDLTAQYEALAAAKTRRNRLGH